MLVADLHEAHALIPRSGGLEAILRASLAVRADREFVLAAVRSSGDALMCAAQPLLDDEEVILSARPGTQALLRFASDRLCNDAAFVRKVIAIDGVSIQYAPEAVRRDREAVLCAVSRNAVALKYVPPCFHADKDVVLAALVHGGSNRRRVGLTWLQRTPLPVEHDYLVARLRSIPTRVGRRWYFLGVRVRAHLLTTWWLSLTYRVTVDDAGVVVARGRGAKRSYDEVVASGLVVLSPRGTRARRA